MVGYDLTIHSVDGGPYTHFHTEDKSQLLPFLEKYDHEGSSITLVARMDNEEAYNFLRSVIDKTKGDKS